MGPLALGHSWVGAGGPAAALTARPPQTEPPPAAEQHAVVRLSAPRATLQLRFPIADLRPERDPWVCGAVRAEQLRLELTEPQFRSELSSGPGPPAPTRLELTCSDLHGKSPPPGDNPLGRGLRPLGEVGLGPRKGLGHDGGGPWSRPHLLREAPALRIPGLLWAAGRVGRLSPGRCRLWVRGRAQVCTQ